MSYIALGYRLAVKDGFHFNTSRHHLSRVTILSLSPFRPGHRLNVVNILKTDKRAVKQFLKMNHFNVAQNQFELNEKRNEKEKRKNLKKIKWTSL